MPIRGPAGTCCIIDYATIHTRLDSAYDDDDVMPRRIMHHVFARAGTVLTDDGTERPGAKCSLLEPFSC